ncbi:shikimate kinase [Gemmatimonadota bacterium]
MPVLRTFRGKPSIALTGFMFTGKSSVGRRLAGKLDLEFVDLDEEIVAEAGLPIPEIFRLSGEKEFRAVEHRVLARVLTLPGRVFSTGGGVVIDPLNRELLERHSCVIWLTALVDTVLARFGSSRGKSRPLLQVDDPAAKIAELLAAREPYYAQCDIRIRTDGRSVRRVTEEIIRKVTGADAIHEG